MDAPSATPEPSRELADLRRRAYGPDADIHRDPAALRRLDELQSVQRPDPPGERAGPSDSPPQAETSATAAASPGESVTDVRSEQPPTPRAIHALGIRFWATLAAVGVVGAVVGFAVSASVSPRADVTLGPTDHVQIDLEDDWLLSVSQWITTDAQPVQHEPFHKLQVLSVTSKAGTSCLVVSWADHWSDYSCTPAGIAPVVDFVAYLGGPQPLEDPLPPGSVIRFELNGDVVDVTMREAPAD
jgi:hypothetical protein